MTQQPRRLVCNPEMLPGLVREVARLSSPVTAIAFARQFGNAKLYVPRRIAAAHPIARCVGLPAAQRICAALGGDTYAVAAATPYLRWLDARALCVLGLHRSDVALRLGIGPRHARKLLEGFDPAGVEIDALVRAVGRHYGIGRTHLAHAAALARATRQHDFGWAAAPGGLRLTPP